jgi:hypothetical protein
VRKKKNLGKSPSCVQLEMTRNRGSLGAGPVVGWKKGKEVGS